MNAKDILQALVTLGKAPKDQVEKAMSDFDVTAAVKGDAMHLSASEEVTDIYADNHAVPSREAVNTGPSQSASGAGAEKMIRDYSNLAPQMGTERDYEAFAKLLGEFVGAQKAQTDAIKNQSALLVQLAQNLIKADDEEEKKPEKDEEEEASEKARALTESLLAKADAVIGKVDALSLKLAATTTAKSKKVIQARIDRLMKDATAFLEKARRGVQFVNDDALTDAFNDIAVKADADPEDDEKDQDDKEEAKKADAKVADHEDEQCAESESAKAILSRVEKALTGMEVMHGEMSDIFNAMSNTSRGKVVSTTALAKSQTTGAAVDDDEKLFDRMSKSILSQDETTMCDNLIQLRAMVKGGARSERDFEIALKKTPDNVKEIFAS